MVVILGIALPITEILSNRIPAEFYQGFYVYLYVVSIAFVTFIYVSQLRRKAVFTIIKNYRKLLGSVHKLANGGDFDNFGILSFIFYDFPLKFLVLDFPFDFVDLFDSTQTLANLWTLP